MFLNDRIRGAENCASGAIVFRKPYASATFAVIVKILADACLSSVPVWSYV